MAASRLRPGSPPSSARAAAPSRALIAERRVIAATIVLLTALSWIGLARLPSPASIAHAMPMSMSMPMSSTPAGVMDHAMDMTVRAWDARALVLTFVMWAAMTMGMMLPSATPTVLTLAGLLERRGARARLSAVRAFVAGYLVVWMGYSAAAALVQWWLQSTASVDAAGGVGPLAAALVLAGAGAFEFTSIKDACLRQCRTPIGFLVREWRPGPRGAFVMGARHGTICVLCCWALMAVMFAAGVMSLAAMLALTVATLVEKLVRSPWPARLTGAALLAWSALILAQAWPA
jgi:predicted metal-binding membrane protein